MTRAPHRSVRGVSLVEALVALAVMAFGLLGVAGLQATLRSNADVSRQRNEAVRIAQARIEAQRAYLAIEPSTGTDYADIAAIVSETTSSTNADYVLSQTVEATSAGRGKSVVVRVDWRDRTATGNAANQAVVFGTLIAGVPPELAGSLALSRDETLLATPAFRHPAIPVRAVARADGTSEFSLPGVSTRFIFSNATGEIVNVCNPDCPVVPVGAHLLSGYVRYATGLASAPGPGEALVPPGPLNSAPWPASAFGFGYVTVQRTGDSPPPADSCLHETDPAASWVAYYCAIPFSSVDRSWSGTSRIHPSNIIAASATDATANRARICRYAPSQNPPRNIDHPAQYVKVTGPLTNQNFLVIDAGNGVDAYPCPKPAGAGPFVEPATWPHQPPP